MKKAPDVLGLPLERAEQVLKEAGIAWRIVKTAPSQTRVVRQSSERETEILLVCDV